MNPVNNLQRFLDAQRDKFATALEEIRNGRKRTHWMWYIFPQIDGLGASETSKYYAIRNMEEAVAYLQEPLLRSRLLNICNALLALEGKSANQVFGNPDDMKLQSSMTLFAAVPNTDPCFKQVLDKYFAGQPDKKTLQLLGNYK